jgi:hypothetical protein
MKLGAVQQTSMRSSNDTGRTVLPNPINVDAAGLLAK